MANYGWNQVCTLNRDRSRFVLSAGSRVAVIGGGPAGSFFSYFFFDTASRVGLEARLDIYEPKNLAVCGPAACNMCGGIVSESLVQLLATEGINLPSTVVQRGIDSYVLHMDVGSVYIDPPSSEKRIGAVHRGGGPRGLLHQKWHGFDGHLLGLAQSKGANVISERVESIQWEDGRPRIVTKKFTSDPYDLLVAAVGVNGHGLKLFENSVPGYTPPKTTKTFICEIPLGRENIEAYLGSSMHVFLLNVPRLKFAAMIPKGDYVTTVLLGKDVDKQMVASFLNEPEVKKCFPPGWGMPPDYCRCFPSINIHGPARPFADRLVFIGDCGENRLYKDGIGGGYRMAKAAVNTVVFNGVSAVAFRRHFLPACRALSRDNAIGRVIFRITHLIQTLAPTRRGMLRMVAEEQVWRGRPQRLSGVLWDMFTGSAPYSDIFARTLHPAFLARLALETIMGFFSMKTKGRIREATVHSGDLGRIYHRGNIILRQGDPFDGMYVIQAGRVEVVHETGGQETKLAELGPGEFFGEMALFEKDVRSATVRALDEVRVLSIDSRILLRKIHEDPSLAFRIIQRMSRRIRSLDNRVGAASANG